MGWVGGVEVRSSTSPLVSVIFTLCLKSVRVMSFWRVEISIGPVFVAAPLAAAEEPMKPRTIIDKAIKAAGGEEKLAKYKAVTWKEKGIYYGMGDGIPYTGSYSVQWPNQFRMVIDNVMTIVLNGDQGWITQSNSETKEMTREQLAEHKEANYTGSVARLLPLKDEAFVLTPLAEIKVGDRPAVGVKVSSKGHRDVSLLRQGNRSARQIRKPGQGRTARRQGDHARSLL